MMLKVLSQILLFWVIILAIFGIERIFLIANFDENFSSNFIFQTFAYGAFHDTRAIFSLFLPLILCGFLSYFVPFKNILSRIYTQISSIYIALVSALCVIMAFVNYFWFLLYKNKIDIFIFGIKDDETSALLEIIWNDYPILIILALAVLIAICCYFLNIKICKMRFPKVRLSQKSYFKIPILLCFNLIIILLYTLGLRGTLTGRVAMNSQLYAFCHISILNDIALNPLIALQWANKQYKNQFNLPQIDMRVAQNLERELFPIYATSRNGGGQQLDSKPHIVINFMESFGLNMLDSAKEQNLDLLLALKKHFDSDFLWERFLPVGNATLDSFSQFFFASPFVNITNSLHKNTKIESPLTPFLENGYEVIFITSGNGAWQGAGEYMKVLGASKVIDENSLIDEFSTAKSTKTGYGIADEFAYQKILNILKDSKNPKLIIHLSISNHAPYKPPRLLLKDIPKEFLEKISSSRESNSSLIVQSYAYAANAFGEFMDKIKEDKNLSKNVIVAMSGDHRQRELKIDISNKKALNYAVPFYLFVPKNLQNNIQFERNRVGSHKDIFPTLMGIVLPNTKYISIGGRDLLDSIKDERYEFGINGDVLITDSFVLQGEFMYKFVAKDSLYDDNNPLAVDGFYKDFRKKYDDLRFYNLQERLKSK